MAVGDAEDNGLVAFQIDRTGTPARLTEQELVDWAADQRVFISSVMGGHMDSLRRRVADVVAEVGAEPVWFETFGGRDDDAQVAYLAEVDSSTIYLGILGPAYGRIDEATARSATHEEYLQAEDQNLAVSVWVQGGAHVESKQRAFIDEVRTFHTTGSFGDADELVTGVRRRLQDMAAADLCPWVKLGDIMFRANQIHDNGSKVTIQAVIKSAHVLDDLENMRAGTFGSRDTFVTFSGQSWPARVTGVETTTTASRTKRVVIELQRDGIARWPWPTLSFSLNGHTYTSDDLTVRNLRMLLFKEDMDDRVLSLGGHIEDFTRELPVDGLAHDLYSAAFNLLLTEALLKSGRAQRVVRAQLSPKGPSGRAVRLEWIGHNDAARRSTTQSLFGVIPN